MNLISNRLSAQILLLVSLSFTAACSKDENEPGDPATLAAIQESIAPGSSNAEAAKGIAGEVEDSEEKSADPLVMAGTALYAKHCESCHGAIADSEVRGSGVEKIASAIVSVPEMKALGSLPSIDLASIAKALQDGVGKGNGKGKALGQVNKPEKSENPGKNQENAAEDSEAE